MIDDWGGGGFLTQIGVCGRVGVLNVSCPLWDSGNFYLFTFATFISYV